MKKLIFSCLILMFTLVAAACSSNNQSEVEPTPQATTTVATSATETDTKPKEGSANQELAVAQLDYEVLLVDPGSEKLEVVKTIKNSTNLDLAASKEIVDGAPATVAIELTKEEADKLKAELEAVGATVELKETKKSDKLGQNGEQSEFEVLLVDPGAKKLEVVKTIRNSTNLDLAASKEIVDGAPATVAKKLSKEEAEKLKTELEAAGATVELK